MSTSAQPLSDAEIALLKRLARGVLPLQAWIESKRARYVPETNPSWLEPALGFKHPTAVPWRNRILTTDDLGAVERIVELMRAPDDTPARIRRWNTHRTDPLRACPIPDAVHWRQDRGLGDPAFGIFEADNESLDAEGRPIDRAAFYREFMAPLTQASQGINLDDETACRKFAADLRSGTCSSWPSNSRSSRTFILQFERDLIAAVMGMRNRSPRTGSPLWPLAVLIELGEHRRVGNAYTPEHVHTTVELFLDRLTKVLKS